MSQLVLDAQTAGLLAAADPDIEDAFADGVFLTGQSPDTIPAVEGYARLSAENRILGRGGVKATLAGLVNRLKSVIPTRVQVSSFSNSYAAYGAADFNGGIVTYRKSFTGEVYLEGLVAVPVGYVSGDVMFNLPAGYRPATNNGKFCAVATSGGYGSVAIKSNGNVECRAASAEGWLSLDGIRFPAEA